MTSETADILGRLNKTSEQRERESVDAKQLQSVWTIIKETAPPAKAALEEKRTRVGEICAIAALAHGSVSRRMDHRKGRKVLAGVCNLPFRT